MGYNETVKCPDCKKIMSEWDWQTHRCDNSNGANAVLSGVGELLPCPFCGSEVKLTSLGGDKENWCIFCSVCNCACAEMGVSGKTKEDIIKAWNKRANFT